MITRDGREWHVSAIIVAGGSGHRMGMGVPKQYLRVCGAPILAWTVAAFERTAIVDDIVLVVPEPDLFVVAEDIVDAYHFRKVARVVAGGTTRQDSTAAGLAAIGGDNAIVLVHDGVRPFVREETIRASAEAACAHGAAVIAVPVIDTIKRVNDSGDAVETIPRESLRAAQTPQAFHIAVLRDALDRARADGIAGTDEAMLIERTGRPVRIVPGDAENIKITVPDDLVRAEEIARRRIAPGT